MESMRDELIEVAAEGIWECRACRDPEWKLVDELIKVAVRVDAEAALDAILERLKEPDENMVALGHRKFSAWDDRYSPMDEGVTQVWTAMLATLSPPPALT